MTGSTGTLFRFSRSSASRFQIRDLTNIWGVAIENSQNWHQNLRVFHRYSTYIFLIANLIAGSEIAPKTAQFGYSSWHDTIRTQIFNWRQSRWNRNDGTPGKFQPGQKPPVLRPIRVTTRRSLSRSVFGKSLAVHWTTFLVQTRTTDYLPGPNANTHE